MGEASRAAYPYRVCEARCFAAARVGPSAEEIWTHRAGARRCALTRRGARGVAVWALRVPLPGAVREDENYA